MNIRIDVTNAINVKANQIIDAHFRKTDGYEFGFMFISYFCHECGDDEVTTTYNRVDGVNRINNLMYDEQIALYELRFLNREDKPVTIVVDYTSKSITYIGNDFEITTYCADGKESQFIDKIKAFNIIFDLV
jgi:hypothetical protein